MKLIFFLFCGIFTGLYLSWPGLVIPENWKCFKDIIAKSTEDKISLKAAMEISPSYVLKRKNRNKDGFKSKNRSRCLFSLICLSVKI